MTNEKQASSSGLTTPGISVSNSTSKQLGAPTNHTGTLTPQMHISRSTTPTVENERVPLGVRNSNALDLRHVSSLPTRDGSTTSPTRLPEQTNTKKKRASLSNHLELNDGRGGEDGEEESAAPSPRAFGDPLKIAQYFPELTQ